MADALAAELVAVRVEPAVLGPSHQYAEPPFRNRHLFARFVGVLLAVPCLLFLLAFLRTTIGVGGSGDPFVWTIGGFLVLVVLRGADDRCRGHGAYSACGSIFLYPTLLPERDTTVTFRFGWGVRGRVARAGGGAYLGVDERGGWGTAESQSAVMVLGPPRSSKTSAVMVPALMASSGAAISTSTKPDVMRATLTARSEIGQAWLFDPSGYENGSVLPDGVRRLCWSPVAAAHDWDGALVMARAMTACTHPGSGTTNETHWTERASALLAPLLYAAYLTDRPIEEVLRWTLRQDLAPALDVLADSESEVASDVLLEIERTDARERSSIFSATAGVLAAYKADAVRMSAARPNFDPCASRPRRFRSPGQ